MFPNHEDWLEPYVPVGGRLALDVGANVGEWTAMLAGVFDEVHSFEPNPQVVGTLRERVGGLPNVRLNQTAVGAARGKVKFNLYPESQHASIDRARDGIIETIDVRYVTLDYLGYQAQPVDFIKVDVEGAEVAVLSGAKRTLLANHPSLIIEVHTLDNLVLCQRLLAEAGYENVLHVPHPHTDFNGHSWLIASA